MSDSPIGTLLELAGVQSTPAESGDSKDWKPGPEDVIPPALRIETFEELAEGMRLEIYVRGEWRPARVGKIDTDSRGKLRALVTAGKGTALLYKDSWENRDRRRVRFGSGRPLRQAAKSMDFGHAKYGDPFAGIEARGAGHREYLLDVYGKIQREEILPYVTVNGVQTPLLGENERAWCSMMWTNMVLIKNERARMEAERREHDRIVVDDDRWEV